MFSVTQKHHKLHENSKAMRGPVFQKVMGDTPVERRIVWSIAMILAILTLRAVLQPYLAGTGWMHIVQDDFFYYLKIAQNIATGHGSTFNGLVSTNGYHPLWLWLIALVVWLGVHGKGIYFFLAASIWLSTIATFFLSLAILRRGGLPAILSAALAVYVAVYSEHLYQYGMEVTLALPLMLALFAVVQNVEWWLHDGRGSFFRTFCLGCLASAMMLSRIDSALLVGFFCIVFLLERTLITRFHTEHLLGFLAGLLPFAAYLGANRLFYGAFMPISGAAKQLKLDHGFTEPAWHSLFGKAHVQLLSVAVIILAIAVLLINWKNLNKNVRGFMAATLLYPFCYIALLSWLSDWQLWGWYFYCLRLPLCVAFLVLLEPLPIRRLSQTTWATAVLTLFALASMKTLGWSAPQDTVTVAYELRQFESTHPGVYAMGDRSGAVGYLLRDPLVQTEGLVMDRKFLDLIKEQAPLIDALKGYNVRYYVATAMTPYEGCFKAAEPYQAGEHAPHMRAEFCEPPVARWKHDSIETLVYDLNSR